MIKIDDLINTDSQNEIIKCVKYGYNTANQIFLQSPIFSFPMAIDHKGNIIRLAVDFHIFRACNAGLLKGFEVNISLNKAKNCSYLELRNPNFIITTNRVKYNRDIPRESIFRNQYADNSQLDFFKDDDIEDNQNEFIYSCITHGSNDYKNVDFIGLGVPDKNLKSWISRKDLDLSIVMDEELPHDEFDVKELDLEFKEFATKLNILRNEK